MNWSRGPNKGRAPVTWNAEPGLGELPRFSRVLLGAPGERSGTKRPGGPAEPQTRGPAEPGVAADGPGEGKPGSLPSARPSSGTAGTDRDCGGAGARRARCWAVRQRRSGPCTCAGAPRELPVERSFPGRRGNKGGGGGRPGCRAGRAVGPRGREEPPRRARAAAPPNTDRQRPLQGHGGAAAPRRRPRPLKGKELLRWNGRGCGGGPPALGAPARPTGLPQAASVNSLGAAAVSVRSPRSREGAAVFAVHVSKVRSAPAGVICRARRAARTALSGFAGVGTSSGEVRVDQPGQTGLLDGRGAVNGPTLCPHGPRLFVLCFLAGSTPLLPGY